MDRSPLPTRPAPLTQFRFHAQLMGGVGDGRSVFLHELASAIVVTLRGGQLVVRPDLEGVQVPTGGAVYRLVEPVGPETPVYVGASWA